MPSSMNANRMLKKCDNFNERFPVGSKIWIAPGLEGGPYEEAEVVAPGAHVLGGHTAVVQVGGRHGCIALTHVRVRFDGALEPFRG